MNDDGTFDDPLLILEFIADSKELLDEVDTLLLEIEKDPSNESNFNTLMRNLHTIKGTSAFLGLKDVQTLSHKTEDVLKAVQDKNIPMSQSIIDIVFDSAGLLRNIVEDITRSEDKKIDEILRPDTAGDTGDKGDTGGNDIEPILKKIKKILAPKAKKKTTTKKRTKARQKLLDEFIVEAEEHFDILEPNMLALEKDPSNLEVLNDVFRSVHTIKGNSDYVGVSDITHISHRLESILAQIRKKSLTLEPFHIELMFESVDTLKRLTVNLKTDTPSSENLEDLLTRLQAASEGTLEVHEEEAPQFDLSEEDEGLLIFLKSARQHVESLATSCEKVLKEENREQNIEIIFRALTTLKGSSDYMVQDELARQCEELLNLVSSIQKIGFDPVLTESLEKETGDLVQYFESIDVVSPGSAKPENVPASMDVQEQDEKPHVEERGMSEKKAPEKEPFKTSDDTEALNSQIAKNGKVQEVKTVRVDQEKLDFFMNLVGELIVVRNTYNHLTERLELENKHSEITEEMKMAVSQLNRISDGLQGKVMEMRMVPVKTVFQRFPRMVRDIAKKRGKKVELILQGEETEIDKTVAELIGDPLVHLIRNAVDHGIETPDERSKLGKNETGTITLKSFHEGNMVVIEILDDGHGIDPQKIKLKAIEKGLVSPDELESLSQKEVFNFIFEPGFSTAMTVTDVSGRGVGMDVVKTNIQKIKGTIDVSSELGKGSRVKMNLPLTLAVFEVLMVGVGKDKFAIPLDYVQETINVFTDEINTVKGREVVNLRGDILGLVRLSTILSTESSNGKKNVPIVVIQTVGQSIGVVVDNLYRRQEILIKPLDRYLTTIKGFSGATITGDGHVVLVLDPSEIVNTYV